MTVVDKTPVISKTIKLILRQEKNCSFIEPAYWSVRSSSRRGGDGVKMRDR